MNKLGKISVIAVLVILVAAAIALKHKRSSSNTNHTPRKLVAADTQPQSSVAMPRLVDIGADKCIPCKMMAPILKELKNEYAGRLQVDFLDVWKEPDIGRKYKIRIIPTQIFYDGSGKELYRHEGFFSKEDILAKWKELGIELTKTK